ncbi:MAG: hypothetical protein L7U87_01255 [Chlamydiales bacterium]|nr:hypothetical protein [Chlamydiales bacterium]
MSDSSIGGSGSLPSPLPGASGTGSTGGASSTPPPIPSGSGSSTITIASGSGGVALSLGSPSGTPPVIPTGSTASTSIASISFKPDASQTLIAALLSDLLKILEELKQAEIHAKGITDVSGMKLAESKADVAIELAAVRAAKHLTNMASSIAQAGVGAVAMGATARVGSNTNQGPTDGNKTATVSKPGVKTGEAGETTNPQQPGGAGSETVDVTKQTGKSRAGTVEASGESTVANREATVSTKPVEGSGGEQLQGAGVKPPPSSDSGKTQAGSKEAVSETRRPEADTVDSRSGEVTTKANSKVEGGTGESVDGDKKQTTPAKGSDPATTEKLGGESGVADRQSQLDQEKALSEIRNIQQCADIGKQAITAVAEGIRSQWEHEEGRLQAIQEMVSSLQSINSSVGEDFKSAIKSASDDMDRILAFIEKLSSEQTQNTSRAIQNSQA